MAATIKGVQPLKFGTTVMSGYITEDFAADEKTDELVIEDETGNAVTQITNFGVKKECTVSVIPKTATARPKVADLFAYGEMLIEGNAVVGVRILSIGLKQIRKDVEKWVIKGTLYVGVDPT
jgi:hypothetical protein